MSARNEILKNVRRAIGEPTTARTEAAPVERRYIQAGKLDVQAKLEQFRERLEDYNAGVYRCGAAALPATISHAMAARAKHSLLIPPQFPEEWLPSEMEFIRDRELTYSEMDASEGSLTACTVAISLTGTIILSHDAHEGRRALTLVPDYHLSIVRADQVVETVPEAIRKLGALHNRPITTISGPSATADIEMTRVKGVHGPRTLDVILVDSGFHPVSPGK
jgi:L-lactate dehydrogenase complex protein LldG